MATNKYAADCTVCGATVPANGGALRRRGRAWLVTHTVCADDSATGISGAVTVTRFNSGGSNWQNSRGRCEDAPCCGCCGWD
jgi:hypothetical protein